MPSHLSDDYTDVNSSLAEIDDKIQRLINANRLLSCQKHYIAIEKSINITRAQLLVVKEIAQLLSIYQIAKKYTLSIKTIYNHASIIKVKLNISTRHNLFHYFINNISALREIEDHTSGKTRKPM